MWLDRHRVAEGPNVEVWTNKDSDDLLHRGEQVRVYFRSSESAYVTVFRIDTDGRVRVIYPVEPWEDNYARAEQRYEVRSYGDRHAFVVDDAPGEGYVFAVASRDPFNYGALVRGDHWDYRVIADGGRVTGDPYVALTDLVDRIIPANYSEYSYDVLPYFVEQHYQYPRFLCYDCHSYASYSYWNPYDYSCFRFRIVIYDDFYYYPYRRYAGNRVIYRTSPRLAPRYVFKDRGPSEAFVSTVKARPVDQSGRRLVDQGVTSRDLGTGRVPAPINTPRARPRTSSDGIGGSSGIDGTSGTGRRGAEPAQGGSSVTRQAESENRGQGVADPRRRPDREPETSGGSTVAPENGGRRPESITPPVRTGETDRQQGQLERRDPNREPEGQPETRGQPETGRENGRRGEPREQPRNGTYQAPPGRERARVVRPQEVEQARGQAQPESRPQEQPKAHEPERRAEPRSQPQNAPAQKPQDSDEKKSGRRAN